MANKPIEVHPLADVEARDAYHYYRKRNSQAADRFKQELDRCFAAIESNPFAFQRYLLKTRRCVLKRFPYLLIFQELPDIWFVVAVAHCRRKPAYWRRRPK